MNRIDSGSRAKNRDLAPTRGPFPPVGEKQTGEERNIEQVHDSDAS